MHCRVCDALLNDFESTRRNAHTFEFVDLCNSCYSTMSHVIQTVERKDLITSKDYEYLDFSNTYDDIKDIKDFISINH